MNHMIGGYIIALRSCDFEVQSLIFMPCTSSFPYNNSWQLSSSWLVCSVRKSVCLVATLIGLSLSPRVLHNSASLINSIWATETKLKCFHLCKKKLLEGAYVYAHSSV